MLPNQSVGKNTERINPTPTASKKATKPRKRSQKPTVASAPGNAQEALTDDQRREMLAGLPQDDQKLMAEVTERIELRNKKRKIPCKVLLPEQLECSVAV